VVIITLHLFVLFCRTHFIALSVQTRSLSLWEPTSLTVRRGLTPGLLRAPLSSWPLRNAQIFQGQWQVLFKRSSKHSPASQLSSSATLLSSWAGSCWDHGSTGTLGKKPQQRPTASWATGAGAQPVGQVKRAQHSLDHV